MEAIEFTMNYHALKMFGRQQYSNVWAALSELVANGFIKNKKGKRELTRMARCMIHVTGYLYEAGRVRANRADINGIFAEYTATK